MGLSSGARLIRADQIPEAAGRFLLVMNTALQGFPGHRRGE